MGRFFDALQRSQAERSGVDPTALPGATDLVENAEQDAARRALERMKAAAGKAGAEAAIEPPAEEEKRIEP